MEIINLDDNLDLTDILDDINPTSSDYSMVGGAEQTTPELDPVDVPEGAAETSTPNDDIVNLDGDEITSVSPPLPMEDEDKPKLQPLKFVREREAIDSAPASEPEPKVDTDYGPKTPTFEPVDQSKRTFSAVPPPIGLYNPPPSTDLTQLLDKATQPQPSGIDKLPEEPETVSDIVMGVEAVPDGSFVQVDTYIENIKGVEYERYLTELDEFFSSSKKKKNKENFNYIVNKDGHFEKRCKEGVDKKKDEVVIIPPKYVKISDALKVINVNLEEVEFDLREMRDKILLKERGVSEAHFNNLKKKYDEESDKKRIFINYKNKINKVDEISKNVLRLSLEKAELRNKLRILFNEIAELNRVPNKDFNMINLKIREYLELNKIDHIDREIKELKDTGVVDYVVMEMPSITKPKASEKKKRVLKKPKSKPAAEEEEGEGEPEPEKPKKKKIVRKKKAKGGKIDIEGLLDIVEDDINVETEDDTNVLDNEKEEASDLTKMIESTNTETSLDEEEKNVLVGGDSIDNEINEINLDDINLDTDLDAINLDSINLNDLDTTETSNSFESNEQNFGSSETKQVKIELPKEEDSVEELNLGDDLEELSNYEEDMVGGNENENYSFENTYKKEVPEDKLDNQIPLNLDDETPIQVKVVKLGHDDS